MKKPELPIEPDKAVPDNSKPDSVESVDDLIGKVPPAPTSEIHVNPKFPPEYYIYGADGNLEWDKNCNPVKRPEYRGKNVKKIMARAKAGDEPPSYACVSSEMPKTQLPPRTWGQTDDQSDATAGLVASGLNILVQSLSTGEYVPTDSVMSDLRHHVSMYLHYRRIGFSPELDLLMAVGIFVAPVGATKAFKQRFSGKSKPPASPVRPVSQPSYEGRPEVVERISQGSPAAPTNTMYDRVYDGGE